MLKLLFNASITLVILTILSNCNFATSQSRDVWCKMTCKDPNDGKTDLNHTMCQYYRGGGKACPNNRNVFLTSAEKRWILEQHNNIRERIAKGEETLGINPPQPKAGNMMKLVYDGELGTLAKRWADQCKEGLHDVCRISLDTLHSGQNVYIATYKKDPLASRQNRLKTIISQWKSEVQYFDSAYVKEFPDDYEKISNYSQMIWGPTIYMGCGYSEFDLPNNEVLFRFVCNYKKKGNTPTERIFRQGEPCSSCPPSTNCSQSWPGICWNHEANQFSEKDSSTRNAVVSPILMFLLFTCLFITYRHLVVS